ncbi:MAG: MFS transporter [Vicinamibacteria bacterium]|nr:MFS transporter [Vicinamibacteria bacterium]
MNEPRPAELSEMDAKHASLHWLIAAVFLQMLPATLLAPAIRPLFAALHAGSEGPMHAFMSLNMLGAILTTPFIARLVSSGNANRSARWLMGLAGLDAVLLVVVSLPLSVPLVLLLRTLEGAAHLGSATLLLARAAAYKPLVGAGRAMGLAGGAVMLAIAFGSGLGGMLVGASPRLPFLVGASLSAIVALAAPFLYSSTLPIEARGGLAPRRLSLREGDVLGPLSAAFVERFTIGLIIVTFALFATRTHGLSDRSVGLLYSMLMLPFALLMYPASRLGDRMPRAGLLGFGALLYGAAIASLAIAPKVLLPASMMVAGVASSLMYGTVLCYAATLVPAESRGRMMALVNTAGALGMLLGPMCGGLMVAAFRSEADPLSAYRNVFYLAGLVCAVWVVIQGPWLIRRLETERGEHALAAQTAR